MKYTIHLWNKKYGNESQFIVEDNTTHKFCEFSPSRPKDCAWVDTNLTKEGEYSTWDDFQKEPVNKLEDIIM